MSDKIKVGIKVRPLIAREKELEEHWIVVQDGLQQVEPVSMKPRGEPYIFDHVFTPDSSNREVFEILVKPIVQSAVRGFNGTIFAYGQTSSGKTYTMMGDKYEPGIIPLAVDFMFKEIENSHGREYLLRVAYMEIYNERVNDLLKKGQVNLKVNEDSFGNVVVKDLSENIVNTPQMCMDFMKKGEQIRKIGETNMNDRSSRSHTIFRVIIESREAGSDAEEVVQVSHLNLVDLAGSERAGATGAVGERLKEGCAINKSLFMLSHVISKLSDGEQFVNFRDSRLTRILQSSLGGNALTAIICAVTPASSEETMSTLGFASRARNIKNTAQVNEVVSDAALLKRYARQINKLKSELEEAKQSKNGICVQEMESKLQEQEKRNRQLQERLDCLKEKLIVSNGTGSDEAREQRMKTLRRRTWTAPSSMRKGRSSLQAFATPSSFLSVPEELINSSSWSIKSSPSEFGMPLEEFEKDLLRRCPSPVILEEEEESEEAFRLDSRFVSTRRGRSSVRSSLSDCESKSLDGYERPGSEKDKADRPISCDFDEQNGDVFTEDKERLKEDKERLKKETERVSLEGTVVNQANQIESLKAENKEFVTQVEILKAENEKLVLQMNSLKAENEQFVTQIQTMRDGNEDFVVQMGILKAENEKLVSQMKSLKAENEEFVTLKGAKADRVETDVDYFKSENQAFLEQIHSLKAENEELAAQMKSDKVDEEAKLSSLEGLLRNQADEIARLVADNEAHVLQIKRVKENAEAEMCSLQETVAALEKELQASPLKTSSSVVGEETPKTKIRREYTEAFNELKDFTRLEKQAYNEELENDVKRLQKELEDRDKAKSDLESKLQVLTERCSDLQKIKEEFDIVRRENLTEVDLKVLLMDSNKTIAELTDANKKLQSEVGEAKKQLKNTEILQVELGLLKETLAEVKHTYQESEKTYKSQLTRMKDLEEERSDFDLKMDVMKKQFVRREQELTNSLEEAWEKLKSYESGDPIAGGLETLLRKEVEKLKTENAKYADQIDTNQEEKIKLTETVRSLQLQLSAVEDGAVSRKEVERLEAENAKCANQIDVDQEEKIRELTEIVSSLERQLSIFRSSDVTRKSRLSALYVLEEEPSIGELSDEVHGLRTENKQWKLRICELEEVKEEYQQQIAMLKQQLEVARALPKVETVKCSNKAVDVSRDDVSYAECDVTLQREDCEREALLAEIEELQRISNVKTEENLELRAALERLSKEVVKQLESAEDLNKIFINESNSNEVLNRSFIDESNTAEAEEYVTCTDDTLATTSKSSCSVLSLEKMKSEEAAGERPAQLQSVDEDQGNLSGEVKNLEDKPCDEVKDICIKRKHESNKDVSDRALKEQYVGNVLDDISIPSSCDVSFVDETATPDFKAKRRRVSRKFAASPRYQQDSPIKEVSCFDELEEANSCLEAELELKNGRIAVLIEEISQVRSKLGDLHSVDKERERLQQVLQDKDKHIADVEAEVLELRASQADAQKLKEDLVILESNIKSKNEVIQKLEANIAMIEEQLRRQGTEDGVSSLKLKEELSELESALIVKSDRIASMEKEVAQLETEVTSLRLVANDADKIREDLAMSKFSCESKEEEEALARQEQVASLQEKLSSLLNVQQEKDLLEEKISVLQKELAITNAAKEERDDLIGKVASLQERIVAADSVTEERDRLAGKVAILQEEISTVGTLEEERRRLIEEVSTLQEKIASIESVNKEKDRLVEEIATLKEKVASMEDVKEEKDRLMEEVNTLQEKIASVGSVNEEKDRLVEEVNTLQEKIASMESVNKEKDRLMEEVAALKEKVALMEDVKEEKDRLVEEVNILQEKIASMESVNKEKDRLMEEIAALKEKVALMEDVKEEKDRLVEEVNILQEKIASMESVNKEKDRLMEEVAALKEKVALMEDVKEEKDRLVEEVNFLQEKIASMESVNEEKDRLMEEVAALEEKIALMEAVNEENDRLVDKVTALEGKIVLMEAVTEEKDRLVEEVDILKRKVASMEVVNEDKDRLLDEVTTLRKKFASMEAVKEDKDRFVEEVNTQQAKDATLVAMKEEMDTFGSEGTTSERGLAVMESLKEERNQFAEEFAILREIFAASAEMKDQSCSDVAILRGTIATVEALKEERDRLVSQVAVRQEKITMLEPLKEERDRLRDEIAILLERIEVLKEEKARFLEEVMELRLNCGNTSNSDDDALLLKDGNDSKTRRTILLGRDALTKERLSLSRKTHDESEKDLDVDQWEDQVTSVRREIVSLQENVALDALKQEKERLEEKLAKVSGRVAQMEADYEISCSNLEKLKEDNRSKAKKIEELEEEKARISASQIVLSDSEETRVFHEQLEVKIPKAAVIDEQPSEAPGNSFELSKLREDLASMEKEKLCKEDRLRCLEGELASLKELLVRMQEKPLDQSVSREIASLQEEVLALRHKLSFFATVTEENERLEREVEESLARISSLEAQLSELRVLSLENTTLKEEVASLQKERSELTSSEAEVCGFKLELVRCEAEANAQKELISKLGKDVEAKQEEIVSIEEKMSVVSEEKECLQRALDEKIEEISRLGSELAELQIIAMDTANQKEHLVQCQQSELKFAKEDLHVKEIELKSVEEGLRKKEGELRSMQEDLCLRDRELKSVKEDLCLMENKLKSVQGDLCRKEEELESMKCDAASMEGSYKILKEELNEREKRILDFESEVKVLEEKTSIVILLAEEKRRLEEELELVRGEKDRLQEELQLKTGIIARFEVEMMELQVNAGDAAKLQKELGLDLGLKKDELAAKEDELESLKIEINRLSPFENLNKALKCELNESKKKVSELESELAETREKVALYIAAKEEKSKLVNELKTKSKELEDQVILAKYFEDQVQSMKSDFDLEKVQLKKTLAAQIEKYSKENEALKTEAQSVRKFLKEQIESTDPEKVCSDNDDFEDLVICLIAAIKKSKSKHFAELKDKFKTHLTELTVKLKRSEASEEKVRQRLEEAELTLKKYQDEIRKIGDLEKTLTAMSDRTKKFESDLETSRSAEASCLRRLQQLSGVADGCVDTCLKRIEQRLLPKADRTSEMANESCILEVRRLKIELSEKEDTNIKLSTKVAELTSRCEDCTVKISSLERLLSNAQEKITESASEAQIKSLLSKLSAKESQIEELQQQVRDDRNKGWLKSPMRGSYSSAEDEYKQHIEMLSKEVKQQTKLAESLAGSLEEQRRLYSESVSKAVVAAERKETARLKDQLNTVTKAAEALQSEKRALATQLADVRLKLQSAINTSDGTSVTDSMDSLANAEALSLKQQVKDLQKEIIKKNAEIEELNERVKELDWECEEVASELRKTRSREEKFYNEVEESAKTIKMLRQVEQDLSKDLAQKQQELSAALLELEERKENEESLKSKISPLVQKGQLLHSMDLHHPSSSTQKETISSHLLSKIAFSENDGCQCDSLRQQVKALRTELSDAKGRNVEVERELKGQSYPFKKKIEVLEGEIKYLKNANSELRADNRRLQNTYADMTVQECEACRVRLEKRTSVEVQTEGGAVRDLWLSGKTSGLVEERNRVALEDKVRKLQKENEMLVTLCKERRKTIEHHEAKLKQYAKRDDCQ